MQTLKSFKDFELAISRQEQGFAPFESSGYPLLLRAIALPNINTLFSGRNYDLIKVASGRLVTELIKRFSEKQFFLISREIKVEQDI